MREPELRMMDVRQNYIYEDLRVTVQTEDDSQSSHWPQPNRPSHGAAALEAEKSRGDEDYH
jgi:hypothetical protein